MTDYIDRQAFRESLINTPFYPRCKTTPDLLTSVQDRLNDTLEILENFPPANVAPVKHGHWEERIVEIPDLLDDPYHYFKRRFYCSSCGDWQTYGKTDYCPMCGASMESERDG